MHTSLIKSWEENWAHIINIAKKRNWGYSNIRISSKANENQIDSVENKYGIKFPNEFKEVLLNYSSSVYFSWQIKNEKAGGILKEVFCGCGRGYLWDLALFDNLFESYDGWLRNCFTDMDNSYDRIWHDKIPIIDVPNGDLIAFDKKPDSDTYPVVYLSHDDGELHGNVLGNDFLDFVTRWSNISCIGTESWQIDPFYDYEKNLISTDNEAVRVWKKWLGN